MRAKHVLPLALMLALGLHGAAIAQGNPSHANQAVAKPLTKPEIQALEREGSIAANLGGAYEAAVEAHAASVEGRDQIALNQVFEARTRLMGVRNLKMADADLNRALDDLLTLTTLAQRRLSSRSPAANDALKDLVLRFSQTMATLPQLGGGGGGPTASILSQKLASELVSDSYRALANAQVALSLGNPRDAARWLAEAQNQLQTAREAPGNNRIQDLLSAMSPAVQVAQMQVEQNSPEALASTSKAIEQLANRLASIR